MGSYRLAIFEGSDGPEAGIVVGDHVVPTEAAWVFWHGGDWPAAHAGLTILAASAPRGRPLASTRLLAPLQQSAIYCAAANYADHLKEMTGDDPPDKGTTRPYFFTKLPHTIIGPNDDIRLPDTSRQVDWEAEIGVVIGQEARSVSVDDAMRYVAGYVIVNDLSARDLMARKDWPNFRSDWLRAKNFDTACPLGPWITPADAITDPHSLAIRTWVNETLMQDGSSNQMIFTIPEQIAYLTEQLTLLPGDVIATGTPAGCGRPRGIFLRRGDVVTIEIEGLGRLRNTVR